MPETPASIVDWAEETFGPAASLLRLAGRANTEMAELVRAVTSGEPTERIGEEAADVAIILCRVAATLGTASRFVSDTPVSSMPVLKATFHANRTVADLLLEIGRPGGPDVVYAGALVSRAFLFLRGLCEALGTALGERVDAKMQINRGRRWIVNGDGTGDHHHVRIEEAA
jgi:hypothetical protein